MPEYLWAESESLARRLALAPLWLAEGPYRVGALLHRSVYRWGLRRAIRLQPRVISIGNLTVGGSGKTPLVGWLAGELRARGRKVAILSRGVRGSRGAEVNVVSDGERVFFSAAEVGDEPVWLASTLPGVPVLAGRNRVALGLRASAVFGAEVLILDDGFQHHRLARDLDLVCVDACLGLGNLHVLPRGPLREPRSALSQADAILFTRVSGESGPAPRDVGLPPGLLRFELRIRVRGLRAVGGAELSVPDVLRGQKVALVTAIARPDRLKRQIEALGAEVVELRAYPDHHLYTRAEIEALDPARQWLTTAKDAVKIPPSWTTGRRIAILEEKVQPLESHRLMQWIVDRLDQLHRSV